MPIFTYCCIKPEVISLLIYCIILRISNFQFYLVEYHGKTSLCVYRCAIFFFCPPCNMCLSFFFIHDVQLNSESLVFKELYAGNCFLLVLLLLLLTLLLLSEVLSFSLSRVESVYIDFSYVILCVCF